MKKMMICVVILLVSAVSADSTITVVCTTTALESLVEDVGGEKVDVISLVQPGVCPSHFDVRPSHIQEVGQASLIMYHGVEPWLDDLITASQGHPVKILIEGPWNTPDFAIGKTERIRDALIQVDPENTEYYTQNAEEIIEEVRKMADAIIKEAEPLQLDTIAVICMDWQKFIVEWMGFEIAGTYPPPETLSVKDVNDLISTGKVENAVLVIDNLQSGTEVGKEIASQIGGYHVVLTNFPHAVPGTDSVPALIEYNARQLLDAVTVYNEEKGEISELKSELEKEKEKKVFFEVISLLLLVVCIVEAVLYVRKK